MPYVQVYEGTLIQVPGVSGWKCDMCGLVVFDDAAIRRIETLIDVDGLPPNQYTPAPNVPPPRDAAAPADDLPEDTAPPID